MLYPAISLKELLILQKVRDNPQTDAITIRLAIQEQGDLNIAIYALYIFIRKLEVKGFIVSCEGDKKPTKGRTRKIYSLTEQGRAVIQEVVSTINAGSFT